LLASLALAALGCGGAAEEPRTAADGIAAVEEAPKPKPRNCTEIARGIVGGRVDALVFANRVREHPVGPKLAALEAWGPILEGTGIVPEKDLERAYVTLPGARDGHNVVLVAEHTLPAARIRSAMEALFAKSDPPGAWVEGLGAPVAKVTLRGKTRMVALPTPTLLVVLPEEHAASAAKFVGSGGCRDPEGREAAVLTAEQPSETLKAPRVPPIPETLSTARATVTLTPDGGADIHVEAKSTSPEQAQKDAAELTSEIDRATSVKVSILRIRMFEPIAMKPDGDKVKGHRHLTAQEIDRIIGFASAFIPREK
jgi:hypothetical protein